MSDNHKSENGATVSMAAGGVAGATAAVSGVYAGAAAGTAGAAALTSGLAAVGSVVGGGMGAGILVVAAAPLAGALACLGCYRLFKKWASS
jgi:hypothetical protein